MSIKAQLSITGLLFAGLLISGCSTVGQGLSQKQDIPAVKEKVKQVSPDTHTHPANKCTNSISHTHASGAKAHKHRYSCKSAVKKDANSHKHPANKCTNSVMHTHPSGANAHKHRYSCQSSGANSHSHPANSYTRSMKHTHPAGARKHTHKYSNHR